MIKIKQKVLPFSKLLQDDLSDQPEHRAVLSYSDSLIEAF